MKYQLIIHVLSTYLFSLFLVISASIFFYSPCIGQEKKYSVPSIQITPNIWGGAKATDIQKVLESTARQIIPYIWQKKLNPIKVGRSQTGPIVLYRRGSSGEYLVRLNTQRTFWSQYAFQFAHELGHIICGYKKGDSSNMWFEESICEPASLFTLIHMTEEWKNNPPYPIWKSYAPAFKKYANDRLKKYPWPKNTSIQDWYKKHKNSLEKNHSNRERNVRIASRLLPFFMNNPSGWETVAFINNQKSDNKISFKNYLQNWKEQLKTSAQEEFVSQIISAFGLQE